MTRQRKKIVFFSQPSSQFTIFRTEFRCRYSCVCIRTDIEKMKKCVPQLFKISLKLQIMTNSLSNFVVCFFFSSFMFIIEHMMPLCMTVSWIYTVALAVQAIVYEKEQRLKEVMKMMGLSNAVHWVAWFITSLCVMSITVGLLVIILKVSGFTYRPFRFSLCMEHWFPDFTGKHNRSLGTCVVPRTNQFTVYLFRFLVVIS